MTIPHGWIVVPHHTELRLCQISWLELSNVSPPTVIRSLAVKADYSWVLHVNGHPVDPQKIQSLVDIPPLLDVTSAVHFLQCMSDLQTCVGNPDPRFVDLAKSKKNGHFLSRKNEIAAYLETGYSFLIDDQQYFNTVRTTSCHLSSPEIRCSECQGYRSIITAMTYRWEKRNKNTNTPTRKTNYRSVYTCTCFKYFQLYSYLFLPC